MFYAFIILLFFSVKTSLAYKSYKCNLNLTIHLKKNELAFFETDDFPKLKEMNNCYLKFQYNNNNTNIHRGFTAYTETCYDETSFYSTKFLTNISSFNDRIFTPAYLCPANLNAYKGFLIFDDNKDNCPLVSISKPFKFTADSQILYIRSSYDEYFNRSYPCEWKFTTSKKFGFKIVIEKFNVSSTTNFAVNNSTEIITNKRSLKLNYPYYNDDIYLHILLSQGDPKFLTQMEFQAYISVFKKNISVVDGKCKIKENISNKSITWSKGSNFTAGYKNNEQCFFDLVIPNNTLYYVLHYFFILEPNVDYIRYYTDKDTFYPLKKSEYLADGPAFEAFKNGTDRVIRWEFISDANYPSGGFYIQMLKTECKCALKTIPCDGNEYSLMNNYVGVYCGNLNCSINISPCSTKLTELSFFTYNYTGNPVLFDIFKILSNGQLLYEVNELNRLENNVFYLNSKKKNIFQVTTFASSAIKILSISAKKFKAPKVDHQVLLTNKTTVIIIEAYMTTLTIIKKSMEMITHNSTIILYSNSANNIPLYNNESLTVTLSPKNCFYPPNIHKCETRNNEVAILFKKTYYFMSVKASNSVNDCVFKSNTIILNGSNSIPVANLSSKKGVCVMTLMVTTAQTYSISRMWTTALHENVKIFVGTAQNTLLFEFNSKSSKTWKNIVLLSRVYTIIIPKDTSMLLNMELVQNPKYITFLISEFPFHSIIATPDFKTAKTNYFFLYWVDPIITFDIGEYEVIFTVIYCKISKSEKLWLTGDDNETKIYLKKIGESYTFKNQTVKFYYTYQESKKVENGCVFDIQTRNILNNTYYGI